MILARVVIERIPKERQKAAMPDAALEERVSSQRPVSSWVDLPKAMDLAAYLRTYYPLLLDEDHETILIYGVQHGEWPDESVPPPPVPFDLAVVGRAHASYKLSVMPTGPSFGLEDWEAIGDALRAVQGDGKRRAKCLLRSVRGHVANLRKKKGSGR